MKIVFCSLFDSEDVYGAFSGVGHFMPRALEGAGCEVAYVGPLVSIPGLTSRCIRSVSSMFSERTYNSHWDLPMVRSYGRQIEDAVRQMDADLILSVSSIPIAMLRTDLPVVLWSDATFALMRDYYPEFQQLPWLNRKAGHLVESFAQRKASKTFMSSEWAAESAVADYGKPRDDVHVVPFGANFECSKSVQGIKEDVCRREASPCKLLAVGGNWFRKGFDVAVKVAEALNEEGLPTDLTIIGPDPPREVLEFPWIRNLGRMNMLDEGDAEQMHAVYSESHFLILPTRADCSPIIIHDLSSFGVPCLASRVGGIPGLVRNGVNGQLFDEGEVDGYVRFVRAIMESERDYEELALNTLEEYQQRLCWKVSSRVAMELMENAIGKHAVRSA